MMNTGGNKVNKKSKFFEIFSYFAAFSPLYLRFIIGESYLSGFIIGGLCSWGVNNIYNVIPDKYDEEVINYKVRKKRAVKKLVETLKTIELAKKNKL